MLKTVAIIFSVFLLAGCGSHGPKTPAGPICKSCKPYFVRGSWHYPQSHYEYDEVGLASWYGPGFHGKPKPYGEPMDQNAMTAAHKTLPLPTIVKVTNLETGKHVIVLVDDRGPFTYEGRIIDLSLESAKRLGTYERGLGRVRVQSLVRESHALSNYLSRYKNGRDPNGRTWIQVYYDEIQGKYGEYAADLGGKVLPASEKQASAAPSTSSPGLTKVVPGPDNLTGFLKEAVVTKEPSSSIVGQKVRVSVGQQFVQQSNAEGALKSLKPLLPNGQIVQKMHPSGQKFYIIQSDFADELSAKKTLKVLSQKGYADAAIIKD